MPQAIHKRLGKKIVTLEFWVAPDLRRFSEELPNADFQSAMKVGYPSLPPLNQLHVIQVRIANESVTLKIHAVTLVIAEGRCALRLDCATRETGRNPEHLQGVRLEPGFRRPFDSFQERTQPTFSI